MRCELGFGWCRKREWVKHTGLEWVGVGGGKGWVMLPFPLKGAVHELSDGIRVSDMRLCGGVKEFSDVWCGCGGINIVGEWGGEDGSMSKAGSGREMID